MTKPRAEHPSHHPPAELTERRGFFYKSTAVLLGGLVGFVPLVSGLAVFLSPLKRKREGAGFLRVASLEAVPDDGIPRQFPIVAQHVDAWTQSVEPIGAVYLRRAKGEAKPECLTATCPHAGCFVAYDGTSDTFKCPCHNSSFTVEGAIIEPSPSPRGMDPLPCQVESQEILVKFENFYTGKAERIVKQ